MSAIHTLLGGRRRIGVDGIIDSRVLCCMRFSDTRVLTGVSGTFLNGETITVRRSGEVVATATIDAVLSSTKLALHGISATINTGDAISGNTSGATGTASTGATELVDVGPGKYTITNSGMTAGAVGTGPFAGDRSIVDSTLAAYCYASNAAFANANASFFRVNPSYLASGGEVFFKFAAGVNVIGPTVEFSVFNYDATRVRIQALLRTTGAASPQYAGLTGPLLPGRYYGVYVDFTNGIRAYLDNVQFFNFATTKPSFGASPAMMLGRYRTGVTDFMADGNSVDSAVLFSQNVWIDSRFVESARYKYQQA